MTAESGYMPGREQDPTTTEAVSALPQETAEDLTLVVSTADKTVVDADGLLFEETESEPDEFVGSGLTSLPVRPADGDAIEPNTAVERVTEQPPVRTEWSVTWEREHILRMVIKPVTQSAEYAIATGVEITNLKNRVERLERENKRLDEFASIVSHDLRNPLNVAMLNLTLLADDFDRSEIETTQRSLQRMDDLISDLLTVAREGQEVDKTSCIDLSTLATAAWQHVETNDARLDVASSCNVICDKTRLSQVFENLFRNAVEHGKEQDNSTSNDSQSSQPSETNHKMTVRVGTFENGIYVEDTGQGIPEDEREDIFELGYSDAETGTGFGLSIVESIVTAHGWQITVTESDSGGARFEIVVDTDDIR